MSRTCVRGTPRGRVFATFIEPAEEKSRREQTFSTREGDPDPPYVRTYVPNVKVDAAVRVQQRGSRIELPRDFTSVLKPESRSNSCTCCRMHRQRKCVSVGCWPGVAARTITRIHGCHACNFDEEIRSPRKKRRKTNID